MINFRTKKTPLLPSVELTILGQHNCIFRPVIKLGNQFRRSQLMVY